VEPVESAKDRPGHYDYAATKSGFECIFGLRGTRYHVLTKALAEVVGAMERKGVQFVLLSAETFSDT